MPDVGSLQIFGVPIDGIDFSILEQRLHTAHRAYWMVTANPEILLAAYRDQAYAKVLQQADVRLIDGFGLWLMLLLKGKQTHRMTGIDLANQLIEQAVKEDWRVGLIGGSQGVAEAARQHLLSIHPTLSVLAEAGGKINQIGQDDDAGEEARHRLTLFEPQLLLVAFGHPKQEHWIARYKDFFPNLKAVVGVGGTFDIWSGRLRRAPRIMRLVGLEWLWRLVLEPRRIYRILDAIVVFPFAFFFHQLRFLLKQKK